MQTVSETQLEDLEQSLDGTALSGEAEGALESLRKAIDREREAEFEKAEPYIRLEIERVLANRVWGSEAFLKAYLKGDKQFQEAVRILEEPELYKEKMGLTVASK